MEAQRKKLNVGSLCKRAPVARIQSCLVHMPFRKNGKTGKRMNHFQSATVTNVMQVSVCMAKNSLCNPGSAWVGLEFMVL